MPLYLIPLQWKFTDQFGNAVYPNSGVCMSRLAIEVKRSEERRVAVVVIVGSGAGATIVERLAGIVVVVGRCAGGQ